MTDTQPARAQVVPPALGQVVVTLNRPAASSSLVTNPIRVVGPQGDVPLTLTSAEDFATGVFTVTGTLAAPLQADTPYTLRVETTLKDQRGGALLRSVSVPFVTGAAGGQQPAIAGVSPPYVSTAGGSSVTVTGSGLSGVVSVTVGGQAAGHTLVSDSQLLLTAPTAANGAAPAAGCASRSRSPSRAGRSAEPPWAAPPPC